MIEGVTEAFAHIEQTPAYKVVILTGYDSYFASGGTKESLLAIGQGKARFTDVKIFQLPLDCPLPVIAAMQGHGIGAGWSLGMFADLVLLSEESRYVSPYMDYGFTPGAGATYILAETIGQDLARESLLTAQYYAGSELKDRGLRLRMVPRAEVYPAAMALARQIAQHARGRLIGLKQQLTAVCSPRRWKRPIDSNWPCMNRPLWARRTRWRKFRTTFTRRSEAAGRARQHRSRRVRHHRISGARERLRDSDALAPSLRASRRCWRTNCRCERATSTRIVQFVDLGLDSISGVTWIRKINEKYHTSIEATKVYSYPTLAQLGRYVKEEAEKHGTLSSPSVPMRRRDAGGVSEGRLVAAPRCPRSSRR